MSAGRFVAPLDAIRLTYGLLVRQLITRGRVLALLGVGILVIVVAIAVGAADGIDDRLEAAVGVVAGLGFTALVPIVSLVFASAALGDAREDGTLVYLWLRPIDRWPVVVGAWLAALTASLPVTLVPLAIAAIASRGGADLVVATVVAATVGTVAYCALFLLFGLLVKNAIVWGIGFVLVWEGIFAGFGSSIASLTVVRYTRSIVVSMTGVDLELGTVSLAAGIIVPLAVAAGGLALASWRLTSMDVA